MAIFRVEKTRDYTVMSNHHLKNKALSLKAKGLLSLILSLPDDWTYTLKGLAAISVEGNDAIRQALAELEKQGYVTRSRVRDAKGQLRGAEYVIYEQPPAREASASPDDVKQTPPESPAREVPDQETLTSDDPMQNAPALNVPAQNAPTPDAPAPEEPMSEFPMLGTAIQSNTNRINTYPINKKTAANPYQSNPNPSNPPAENMEERMGWERDGFAAAESFQEAIKKRIEYGVLAQDAHIDQGRLDEIVNILLEVLCAANHTMFIAGNEYPTVLVQERFRQITGKHIQYVFHCLNKNTSQVRNIKKYLLAVLFNAPVTMDGYYAALINHDYGSIAPDGFDCDLDELPDGVGGVL